MKELAQTRLIAKSQLELAYGGDTFGLIDTIEGAFKSYAAGEVILPDKASQVFDELTQSRINCMPSTVRSLGRAGVKWVSVFPKNPIQHGLPNVGGLMVLSEISAGQPLAVMDAGYLTALRTAGVDALAAKYLAPKDAKTIAIIGTGEQARFHAMLLYDAIDTLTEVRVCGRTSDHVTALVHSLNRIGINAVDYGVRMSEAISDANILVTAISGQAPVLKADWVPDNCLYCHVGGWEDEYKVPLKADKIVCDSWEALKHRGSPTIARMFSEGLLANDDIYCDLDELVCEQKPGREGAEFIYFNGIGLSFVDVAVAGWLYNRSLELGLGSDFCFNA